MLFNDDHLSFAERLKRLNIGLIIAAALVFAVGLLCLYSAADGSMDPWANKHLMRFGITTILMIGVALIDIHLWMRLAFPLYIIGIVLLLIVEIMGFVGMGAQRWINLGFMRLQPSELMKIALVMALARYYHGLGLDDTRKVITHLIPLGMILLPVGLVMLQPDLGTALMTLFVGGAVMILAGLPVRVILAAFAGFAALIPTAWFFVLHPYQKQRVETFLNPESDPLGAGYHIIQSKIALGSGGIEGKGFLDGTQSRLNFLPEKQTDFIFTIWAEEWGLMGGIGLLALFAVIFAYAFFIAQNCRHAFGRFLAMGLGINFSLYVFINIGMVMGLIPVVGAPLPLISYGGTAMMAAMISFGLIMSCSIFRHAKIHSRSVQLK